MALFRGETSAARALLDNSLSALDRVPPDAPPFFTVCTPAWSVDSIDDLLFPVFEETVLVGRRVGAAQSRGYILATRALAARMGGRFDEAGVMLDQALRTFEPLGDRAGQAHILAQRGHLLRSRGDPAAARECFRSAADLRTEIPDQRGTAIALTGVALAAAALGDGQRARALGREACRILDRSGDLPGHAGALNNLAVAEVLTGRPGQAIDLIERALALRATPALAGNTCCSRACARCRGRSWQRWRRSRRRGAVLSSSASGVAWRRPPTWAVGSLPVSAALSGCKVPGHRFRSSASYLGGNGHGSDDIGKPARPR